MAARDYRTGESLVAIQGTGWINNHCSVQSDNDHSHIPQPATASVAALLTPCFHVYDSHIRTYCSAMLISYTSAIYCMPNKYVPLT